MFPLGMEMQKQQLIFLQNTNQQSISSSVQQNK